MATVKSDQDLVKQITFAEEVSSLAANLNQSAPKSDEETASRQERKSWNTQLVPEIGAKITSENNGPVIPNNPIQELKQEPYKLPDGFSWNEVNILNDDQLRELYIFLNENYVEDDDNMFRFDYSMPFLRWVLGVPGWLQKWHLAIRVTKSGEMVGFISSVPSQIKVYDKQVYMVERNFLCVHKKLRRKRMAPVLIKEVTRRVSLQGVFQAVYTAGAVLPGIVSKCR
jgi:glycylpeptide N-tetradecanoyltransferase